MHTAAETLGVEPMAIFANAGYTVTNWDNAACGRSSPDTPVGREVTVIGLPVSMGRLRATPYALVFASDAIRDVVRRATKIAMTGSTVLLEGETGTGKELLARFIHDRSDRRERELVAVNCAALSESLVESELFGHKRGSFTGAERSNEGLLLSADGGTLFLDEIGDLPMSIQAKLLRAVEYREFRAVGDSSPKAVDVRLIAATNKDLSQEIRSGRFRADLYYRLCETKLTLPPLRSRPEDIEPLALLFLSNSGHPNILGITPGAVAWLGTLPWRGNARELRNAIGQASLASRGSFVTEADLGELFREQAREQEDSTTPLSIAGRERAIVVAALTRAHGQVDMAAKELGVSRATMYRRIRYHGLMFSRKVK